jgi:hypothetical protein
MPVRDVVVSLGGQEHVLRSDLGAWAAVEDHGEDYLDLVNSLGPKPKMRTILLLVWAYLDHEKPRPSMDEVKRWVTTDNFRDVTQAIVLAFRDGAPEVSESPGPQTADAGTGPPSASSPLA